MQIGIETSAASRISSDVAIVFASEGASVAKAVRAYGRGHGDAYKLLQKRKIFTGKVGQIRSLYDGPDARVPTVILVGVGDCKDANVLRAAAGTGIRAARDVRAVTVSVVLPEAAKGKQITAALVEALGEGLCLGLYRFDRYKAEAKKPTIETVDVVVSESNARRVKRALVEAEALAGGVALARDLGNEPGNTATPTYLAQIAADLAKREPTLSLDVLEEDQMEALGMGSLLGVSKGSAEPAKLIILTYTPKRKSKGRRDTVALVGKGITFDTGGISIKPGARMDEMKFDMCGGAAVIGTMQAIAQVGVNTRVVGLVPAVENMPGGAAYKPGDILEAMNGTTIEVKNTDAEGRLVLADALAYAATKLKPKPKALVDMATLTGACLVALGSHNAALVGNDETLVERILEASDRSGDGLWRMPLSDAYRKQVESPYADVANLGSPGAGTITAAAFLEKFTAGLPWSHLDIAGMAWTDKTTGTFTKGATGFGVRVLVRLLQSW